jgi:hypothetical protein
MIGTDKVIRSGVERWSLATSPDDPFIVDVDASAK